ncbi:MAG: undecaprenyl-diphosphatase [Candidatus Poribacteria bacterium]|nr:MAG: undecaprenyl-diphosphatase [Candidatus Poribacteria bacterium]
MGLLEAAILGLVQGASEFLPISSSGHLVLVQHLLGLGGAENLVFDLLLHAATLGAVALAFRRELYALIRGAVGDRAQQRLLMALSVAFLTTVLMALGIESLVKTAFEKPSWVGAFLMTTGGLLYLSPRLRAGSGGLNELGLRQAIWIGLIQGAAALPGISRSGATICAGILAGLHPEAATRFSFLLSIPTIAAAIVWSALHMDGSEVAVAPVAAGMLVALVVGLASIRWLLRIARRGRFDLFAVYTALLGAAAIIGTLVARHR